MFINLSPHMSGSLLGNARAGWMAAKFSVPVSIFGGGMICAVAVMITAFFLPQFWKYRGLATSKPSPNTEATKAEDCQTGTDIGNSINP